MIDHVWMNEPPADGLNESNFSISWSGIIKVPLECEYTFYVDSDGPVELSINGEAILNID